MNVTAFFYAARGGSIEIMKWLMEDHFGGTVPGTDDVCLWRAQIQFALLVVC